MQNYQKVILLGNGKKKKVTEVMSRLEPEIGKLFEIVACDDTGTLDLSETSADFAIVFGGDGSLLHAVRQMGPNQVPVLAVHLGSLGFLSNLSSTELLPILRRPDFCNFDIRNQLLMICSVFCGDRAGNEQTVSSRLVVNEVAFRGGPPFEILKLELFVDGDSVTVYHGDGLLISTPVGSSAHALSAGGPILRKDLDVVVISPLNPHTLSNRPVIDSATRRFEVRTLSPEVFVIIDGEAGPKIGPGDRVLIEKAPYTFKMIRIPGQSYYRTIREKLGWSGGLLSDSPHR